MTERTTEELVRQLAVVIKAAHDAGPHYQRWERAARAALAELARQHRGTESPRAIIRWG